MSIETFNGVLFGTPNELIDDKELYHEELDLFPAILLSNEAVAILIKENHSNLQKILPREIRKLDLKDDFKRKWHHPRFCYVDSQNMFECTGKTFFGLI